MRAWFAALRLDRKLIVMTLAVSAAALAAALVGLLGFDIARFRTAASEDARALAQVIAENTAAAILFDDADAARQTLSSVRVRPMVTLACVYHSDGGLLAEFSRESTRRCPTQPQDQQRLQMVASIVPVLRNGRAVGSVYVERTLTDLAGRVLVTSAAGGLMLLLAGALAFALAQRIQRVISTPIVALADAANAIARDERRDMPDIPAAPDETGDLVRAFAAMVHRLLSSNEALRTEVDERRRMQAERETLLAREREASRVKDEFLAALSHELRTPLNAILGWTQILQTTHPSEQTMSKAIASLSRNAQAQSRVIEDLLDVSRIITGKLQLSIAPMDLRSMIDAAIEVVAPMAAAKGIDVLFSPPGVPCIVEGDYDRLRQVVWNLLSNAVKFTPNSGHVIVRLRESDAECIIEVSDTGIGIPRQFIGHVFERFRQADGSMTREHGGLGLGLAIVKELTELHGGSVRAQSTGPGHGATFTVTLPRPAAHPLEEAEAADVRRPESIPRLDGVTVLAVDDNPDALDIVAAALTDAGATVRVAASGREALACFERERPHVIVCDLAMPQMDGFAVLRQVRQNESANGRRTPVLALTAYASDEYRKQCADAGFDAHLAKPCNTRELVRAVASVLPPSV